MLFQKTLERAGLEDDAREIVLEGPDRGNDFLPSANPAGGLSRPQLPERVEPSTPKVGKVN
jgi:hypothetical protein